jgi:hypothetical protein
MTAITLDNPNTRQDTNAEPALSPPTRGPSVSKRALWAGRIVSGLAVLFLAFDASMKVLQVPAAVESTVSLGYPAGVLFGIGVVQVLCLLVYLIPRTAMLGAILWTGYLGGAIATHLRVGNPLLSHTLFPIYIAAFIWVGLWLRDTRVRAVFPLRSPS